MSVKLVENKAEQKVIKAVNRLRKAGLSFEQVRDELIQARNEQRIKSMIVSLVENKDEQEILSIAKELRKAGMPLKEVARKLHSYGFSNRKNEKDETEKIPYGWQIVDDKGTLVKNEVEQEIAREVRRLRKAGLTLKQIAKELEAVGNFTRKDKDS